jgi:hypothetical protein
MTTVLGPGGAGGWLTGAPADVRVDRIASGPGAGGREFVIPAGAGGVEADISAMAPVSIIPAVNPAAEIAVTGLQPAMR